jgi:hypothetical protein
MPSVVYFLEIHRGKEVDMHFDGGDTARVIDYDLVQRTAGARACSSVFGVSLFANHDPLGRRGDPGKNHDRRDQNPCFYRHVPP